MTLKFITIPAWIMYRTDLKLAEKVILSIVSAFADGAKLSNSEIGEIVGMHPENVSRMIAKLQAGGWIKITGKQSRWRRIYFDAGDKVKSDDTLTLQHSTLTLATTYIDAGDKQNIKGKEVKADFTFSDVKPRDTKTTPAKTPDPEKLKRVFADLGFDIPAGAAI
jgi:DNA-binding Lrp family transcriptional regulator